MILVIIWFLKENSCTVLNKRIRITHPLFPFLNEGRNGESQVEVVFVFRPSARDVTVTIDSEPVVGENTLVVINLAACASIIDETTMVPFGSSQLPDQLNITLFQDPL